MASDVRLTRADGVTIFLVNSSGSPTIGGDPGTAATTPFGVRSEWMPAPGEGDEVEEVLPLIYLGTTTTGVQAAVSLLNEQFSTEYSAPAVLSVLPNGALQPTYYEVYDGLARALMFGGTERSPAEGATSVWVDLKIRRSPLGGAPSLTTLLGSTSFTNKHTGNVFSLGTFPGDLQRAGQPLNITIAKPASQAAYTVFLATVHARTPATINSTLSGVTNTTTGSNFTASGSVDASILRARRILKLRVMARVKTLTNPTAGQIKVTVSAAGGSVLWAPATWHTLGANTSGQLIDLGGIGLDQLRYPLSNTTNITVQIALRSISGTAVTATLDYIECLFYYDFCRVESSAGLASGQRYQLLGAQNLSGGPWLPVVPEQAKIVTTADALIGEATIKQPLVRAYAGASLYAGWVDSGGAHTDTDTAAISAGVAVLYRGLRG